MMLVLAGLVIGGVGMVTVLQLSGTEARMDEQDREVFSAFLAVVSDPRRLKRVQISRRTSFNDYTQYAEFDTSLLAEMEYVHYDYLYGGSGKAEGDIYVKLTLRSADENEGTEIVVMQRDGDLYRVEYHGAAFVVRCDAMTEWIDRQK